MPVMQENPLPGLMERGFKVDFYFKIMNSSDDHDLNL